MAFSISVKMETERAEKYLRKAAKKQLPFATAVALTKTAKHLAEVERRSLSKHLDRPTPFTKKAFAIKPARKQDFKTGRIFSRLFIKDAQEKYLRFAIEGGTRRPKNRAIVVPGQATRLNRYGNLSRNFIKNMLAKPNVFTTTINGTGAIVQRMRSGILKTLVIFTSSASYEKRLPFFEIAKRVVPKRVVIEMNRALRSALRTAR